jgi:hypothetical protein
MKKSFIVMLVVSLYIGPLTSGQTSPEKKGLEAITVDALKAQLGFLASDWTEGREAGEKGEYLASDYIASILQLAGVGPGGDFLKSPRPAGINVKPDRSYFQNFIIHKTEPGAGQVFQVKDISGNTTRITDFGYNTDFVLKPSYPSVEIEAPALFIGYGFRNDKLGYDDLAQVDIRGKVLLKITGIPEFARTLLTPEELADCVNQTEAYELMKGAAAVIEFNPSVTSVGNPEKKEFMNMAPAENWNDCTRPVSTYAIPGITIPDKLLKLNISARAANELLGETVNEMQTYIEKADSNKPCSLPVLAGKTVIIKTSVTMKQVAVRNVIGVIEGKDRESFIVLGAHYDHVGSRNGFIWNGADDNCSGTVGVMTLARAFMATGIKPERTIIIALWTAEETGLLGSRYFVKNPGFRIQDRCLYFNFDMISRYISEEQTSKIEMTYTNSVSMIKEITNNNLAKYGIDLKVDYKSSDDPPGGTDHRSFVNAGIPVIRYKAGHRVEYHTPYDEINTVDWDIMEKIIRLSFLNAWEMANKK